MKLAGLQKTTLIDFPQRVACSVFTLGCNFTCPFCHNKELVTTSEFIKSKQKLLEEKDFFNFLNKRKKVLDGVCITGGEPTLQRDLIPFCQKIKDLGLEVKLDTNGSRPKILKNLLQKNLVDCFAIDFKTSWENYFQVSGFKKTDKVRESIKLILKAKKPLQLRTTIVPTLHGKKILLTMAKQLKEFRGDFSWKWQQFQPQNTLDPKFEKVKPHSEREIMQFVKEAEKIIPVVYEKR